MKAIVYTRYGGPDVLHLADLPEPAAGDRQVLIRVRAAEATKSDCELRSFRYAVRWFWLPLRIAVGIRRPRRRVLGGYFAGEVVSVGARVTSFAPGDQVYGSAGLRLGAYGEYLVVGEDATIAPKPRNMTFAEAAAVPLGGLNALHFMRRASIKPGDQVLINGAGGSIGAHAVQIAHSMGARVTAVDQAIKEELVRRLGADDFIDYTTEDVATTGRTFDVILDMVPGSPYRRLIGMLHPGGRYLNGNPRLSVLIRSALTTRLTDKTVTVAFAAETKQELAAITEMIEAQEIRSIVDRTYPMSQAVAAHRRVETEQRLGAVVIIIGEPDEPAGR
ncbi:NAD(P)-dependent alcohol dehydrogenase [Amorphoplanes digitatis]|uniref:NADPH:quinone reductase-like Zn-dependent oxidoreductase n=1 Tax=Actinoplanes digitatis TaxID=1868 RepID=A0A7W7HYM6_9ACTN|nr:NAD(P)-dependent alcohol dehydrogenase [Actinoplanes digitatis]MBB4763091.1 NADPH:quinone reductase-like Zn-dependent oxidoreductase [Actinoplanes digitatis]BFE72092.1 NAD(P)-dependent alcohol dehydrogenase [Actinoplanes digitatis]GID97188.1 NADPH:quinone oxidoreductase [Actinoplanes digitatis]